MEELPKTAVGKIFKPNLRKSAITRVFNKELQSLNVKAKVENVKEDKLKGLVALISMEENTTEEDINNSLNKFIYSWEKS